MTIVPDVMGGHHEAVKEYKSLLEEAQRNGDFDLEKGVYMNLGQSEGTHGNYHKANEYHKRALKICQKEDDKTGEFEALQCLCSNHTAIGDYKQSLKLAQKCLMLSQRCQLRNKEMWSYSLLADSYMGVSNHKQAIECSNKSIEIAQEIGDKEFEGKTLTTLANTYRIVGKYKESKIQSEKRLSIAEQVGDRKGEYAAYRCIGDYHFHLEDYSKAFQLYKKSLELASEVNDMNLIGGAYLELAKCYLRTSLYKEADEHNNKALNIAKKTGSKGKMVYAYRLFGELYRATGNFAKAESSLEVAIQISREQADIDNEAASLMKLGIVYIYDKNFEKSEEHLSTAVNMLESIRRNLRGEQSLQVSILDTHVKAYKYLQLVQICLGKDDEALITSERGRSCALADLMTLNYSTLLEEAAETASTIADVREIVQLAAASNDSQILFYSFIFYGVLAWVIDPLKMQLCKKRSVHKQDIEEYVRELVVKARQELDVRGTEQQCEDRSLDCLYGKSDCATAPPNIVHSRERNATSDSLQSIFRECTRNFIEEEDEHSDEKTQAESALTVLFQMLIAPVRGLLEKQHVVVIPEGPLYLLPFAALKDNEGKYLSGSLKISIMPSLSTYKIILESPSTNPPDEPLIVGDPEVGCVQGPNGKMMTIPRLTFAKREAEMVAKLLGVAALMGNKATKEAVMHQIQRAQLVHIAAHGDIKRGAILLAPTKTKSSSSSPPSIKDIMLTVRDLESIRLSAQLVVLSCCHSGRGEIRAEGVIGIARAFLGAGARAVLVSLWAISDQATIFFMKSFYQHLSSGELMKYWAPFVHIGKDIRLKFRK